MCEIYSVILVVNLWDNAFLKVTVMFIDFGPFWALSPFVVEVRKGALLGCRSLQNIVLLKI